MPYVMLPLLLALSASALADGGKVRDKSPVFNEDGEVVGVVVPVDCKEYTDHSGQTVYFCAEDEDEE